MVARHLLRQAGLATDACAGSAGGFVAATSTHRMSLMGRYAELCIATPMRRAQLRANRVSGGTNSPGSLARAARQLVRIVLGAMSIRFARCQRLVIPCAVRRARSLRECASSLNSWEAPQTLALSRVDRSRWRHGVNDYRRDRQLAAETVNASQDLLCVKTMSMSDRGRKRLVGCSSCRRWAYTQC